MNQSTLFPTDTARYEAWATFHRDNPHVFELFMELALKAARRGVKAGPRQLWEVMRWNIAFETTDQHFKLNDHLCPYYSRLAMLVSPELNGFFERRDARFDASDAMLLEAHEKR